MMSPSLQKQLHAEYLAQQRQFDNSYLIDAIDDATAGMPDLSYCKLFLLLPNSPALQSENAVVVEPQNTSTQAPAMPATSPAVAQSLAQGFNAIKAQYSDGNNPECLLCYSKSLQHHYRW